MNFPSRVFVHNMSHCPASYLGGPHSEFHHDVPHVLQKQLELVSGGATELQCDILRLSASKPTKHVIQVSH